MHDAGARNGGELRRVVQQGIQQRALPVAAARMHHQAGRLVDDEDVRVLVQDRQRDVLRLLHRLFRQGSGFQRDAFAAPHLALGIGRRIVQTDFSLFHPGGKAAARMFGQQPRQRLVEAQAGAVGGNFQDARRRG